MIERELFRTQVKVRHYELDTLGHLNHAIYHSYAEVARLDLLELAGGFAGGLDEARLSSVLLESHIRFRCELRAGDIVEVTCDTTFGSGKTFRMDSDICKLDGTLSAEITCTLGLMDLGRRKLVDDPRGRMALAGVDLRVLSRSE